MDGLDLVPLVTSAQRFDWNEGTWILGEGLSCQPANRGTTWSRSITG